MVSIGNSSTLENAGAGSLVACLHARTTLSVFHPRRMSARPSRPSLGLFFLALPVSPVGLLDYEKRGVESSEGCAHTDSDEDPEL